MEWWIGAACITGGHASMPSLCSSFFGAVCAAGKGTFLKCKSSRACWQRGGMPNDAAGNSGSADAHHHRDPRDGGHYAAGVTVHRRQT